MADNKLRYLTCCVCGEPAGRFEQWHNRDTGYGVCAPCVQWLQSRGETPESIRANYGLEGVHYGTATRL